MQKFHEERKNETEARYRMNTPQQEPQQKRRGRGPGKKPRKVHVSARLEADVYNWLLSMYGKEWRGAINTLLRQRKDMASE
jgi:uncharacterized protein (DUF4415 family)